MDACRIPLGTPALVQVRAHLRRHVGRLDDVLDADRHAVDRRARPAFTPAPRRLRGSFLSRRDIQSDEGANPGLKPLNRCEAALQIGARRIAASAELSSTRMKGDTLQLRHPRGLNALRIACRSPPRRAPPA